MTPEDEAFEDIERKQGGGFQAKRQMAVDKLQEPAQEQEEDWGALAEKQLASIKRDTRASFEDAMVCATHKVMAEFEAQPAPKTEREALKLAIDGLEKILHTFAKDGKVVMASMIRNELFAEVNSLLQQAKASLAQPPLPVQEPVAWISPGGHIHFDPYLNSIPLYTTPPKREWVGLTDDEIDDAAHYCVKSGQSVNAAIRAIEAKLKEKNA